jgi:hypothetical protein
MIIYNSKVKVNIKKFNNYYKKSNSSNILFLIKNNNLISMSNILLNIEIKLLTLKMSLTHGNKNSSV